MTILLAFVGALGVWLTFTALTHKFVARMGSGHEDLKQAASRQLMQEDDLHLHGFADIPLLDRALRPILEPASKILARLLRRMERDEERILQAGYPKRYPTVYDFYAWKVIAATVLFVAGIANALVSGVGFLPVAFGLGVMGLFLPDYHLSQLIRKRREALRTEMAFALHRLVILIEAKHTLSEAIGEITQKPGGPFIQELKGVMNDFNTGKYLERAMENLAARNPGTDDISRFAELVIRANRLGQPIAEPLRNMANVMQAKVEAEVESRGMATSVKMVLPIGLLVLPAIGIVVMGPAIYLAAQYFFR